jgi:outer membrane protein assembly factor BamB
VVADGTIYLSTNSNKVYALSTADGHVLWTYDPHSVIDLSPTVAGDAVYVAAQNQTVYALSATASS